MKNEFHFNPARADEPILFGACRPGYSSRRVSDTDVGEWTDFMRAAGITRVVCLLDKTQLAYYDDLPGAYRAAFGPDNVLEAPVADFRLPSSDLLFDTVFPFVGAALRGGEKTVIHCSAGCGRTGFMLAACLVAFRGLSPEEAIDEVAQSGRDACESGDFSNVELLLNACQQWRLSCRIKTSKRH